MVELEAIRGAMAAPRAAFWSSFSGGLRNHERIVAAWLIGSLGRGDSDELSDIDTYLAVADAEFPTLNAQRWAFVSPFGELIQNAPPDGAVQLVLYCRREGGCLTLSRW